MNIIHIAGHLGADPETRVTQSGHKVTTFRVGTKTRKNTTIWWRVTVWGDQFDNMIQYLKKGSAVMVVGDVSAPEIYTDKEGKPQVSMQITAIQLMFSPFGKPASSNEATATQQTKAPQEFGGMAVGQAAPVKKDEFELEEDIPF
ncbi:MAG: single-stranded DNA-binding protein [Chlamydiae bacterium]|nr:single-stranded DNA-binding protein [Chlamydiota bacterium]